jgi:hypothetical protein
MMMLGGLALGLVIGLLLMIFAAALLLPDGDDE